MRETFVGENVQFGLEHWERFVYVALEWGKTFWLKGANWVMGKFRVFQGDAYRIYKQPLHSKW